MTIKTLATRFFGSKAAIKIGIAARSFLNQLGIDIHRIADHDVPPYYGEIYNKVRAFTMTSRERVFSVIAATEHIVHQGIHGDIVECGAWKGGSAMACLYTLKRLGVEDRDIYLYDTYSGMPKPSAKDGDEERLIYDKLCNTDGTSQWCLASMQEVRDNLYACGYPVERVHLIKGMVEETIPATIPSKISLLRLDTDWYESTLHELRHLYPLLQDNGILILDDYGTWTGCHQAADEFFAEIGGVEFMHRIDANGRTIVRRYSTVHL